MNPMYLPIYYCLPRADEQNNNNSSFCILDNLPFILTKPKTLTISVFIAGLEIHGTQTNSSLSLKCTATIASSTHQGINAYHVLSSPPPNSNILDPGLFSLGNQQDYCFGPKPVQIMSKITESLPAGPAMIQILLTVSYVYLANLGWKEIRVCIE